MERDQHVLNSNLIKRRLTFIDEQQNDKVVKIKALGGLNSEIERNKTILDILHLYDVKYDEILQFTRYTTDKDVINALYNKFVNTVSHDRIGLTLFINRYIVAGDKPKAMELVQQFLNLFDMNEDLCIHILSAYAEIGDYASAKELLTEMKSKYKIPYTINSLNLYLRSFYNHPPKVFEVYKEIASHGFKPNSDTYDLLLQVSTANYPHFSIIQKLLNESLESHVYPSYETLNQLIIRLAENTTIISNDSHNVGNNNNNNVRVTSTIPLRTTLKHQLTVLYYLRKMNYKPSLPCYTNLLKTCALLNETELALSLFDDLLKKGLHPNTYSYTALMSCLAQNTERCDLAVKVFTEMQMRGLQPNLITCNTLLLACAKAGLIDSVKLILNKMKEVNILPNMSTHCKVILAYAESGRFNEGYEYINEILKDKNNQEHYLFKCIMYLCSKNGNMNKVCEYIDIMVNNCGIKLNGRELFSPMLYVIKNRQLDMLDVFLSIYEHNHLTLPNKLQLQLLQSLYDDRDYKNVIKYSNLMINKLGVVVTSALSTVILKAESELRKIDKSYNDSLLNKVNNHQNFKSFKYQENQSSESDEHDIFEELKDEEKVQEIITPVFDGVNLNFVKQ